MIRGSRTDPIVTCGITVEIPFSKHVTAVAFHDVLVVQGGSVVFRRNADWATRCHPPDNQVGFCVGVLFYKAFRGHAKRCLDGRKWLLWQYVLAEKSFQDHNSCSVSNRKYSYRLSIYDIVNLLWYFHLQQMKRMFTENCLFILPNANSWWSISTTLFFTYHTTPFARKSNMWPNKNEAVQAKEVPISWNTQKKHKVLKMHRYQSSATIIWYNKMFFQRSTFNTSVPKCHRSGSYEKGNAVTLWTTNCRRVIFQRRAPHM